MRFIDGVRMLHMQGVGGRKSSNVSGGILHCEPTLKARLGRLAFCAQPRIDE